MCCSHSSNQPKRRRFQTQTLMEKLKTIKKGRRPNEIDWGKERQKFIHNLWKGCCHTKGKENEDCDSFFEFLFQRFSISIQILNLLCAESKWQKRDASLNWVEEFIFNAKIVNKTHSSIYSFIHAYIYSRNVVIFPLKMGFWNEVLLCLSKFQAKLLQTCIVLYLLYCTSTELKQMKKVVVISKAQAILPKANNLIKSSALLKGWMLRAH